MILPRFRLGNCLIYKVFVPSPSLIQVGTFLATIDFEEGKPMTDSHLRANKSTIMVVDDDPDLVDMLRITLELKGFNVRCAYSGPELLASLEEQKPDLIIINVIMPEMDGLEVLRRLKSAPETLSIPVIMLTALNEHEDMVRGYKTGADYYIPKPFTKDQLLEGINLILGGEQGRSVQIL
jgi:DNA-binding response OmpR family regulator